MNYISTLLAVKDMEKSLTFYREILGLNVIADFGANKTLSGGIVLQTADSWANFIQTKQIAFEGNAEELYFEEDDIDDFIAKLQARTDVRYVHPLKEHSWGQRVVRIYDLDNHILEIGENLKSVAKRFAKSGMTPNEIAVRMDIPLKNVHSLLQ